MGLATEAVHVHDPAVPFFAVGIVRSAETCRDLQELQYVHQQITQRLNGDSWSTARFHDVLTTRCYATAATWLMHTACQSTCIDEAYTGCSNPGTRTVIRPRPLVMRCKSVRHRHPQSHPVLSFPPILLHCQRCRCIITYAAPTWRSCCSAAWRASARVHHRRQSRGCHPPPRRSRRRRREPPRQSRCCPRRRHRMRRSRRRLLEGTA